MRKGHTEPRVWTPPLRELTPDTSLGFDVIESTHPIVAIMLYDAPLAVKVAARMLELGVYVVGFCYPVVPEGKARIRTQVSAAHTKEDLDFVLAKLAQVKEEFGL